MEQIIINVDNIILSFVHGSFGSLSETVHALWRLMFIVFIAVYGYKIMVSGRFSTSDLIMHCLKIIVLLVLATSWDVFFQFIYRMVTEMPSEIAGQMMHAASESLGVKSQADSVLSANAALSSFYDRVMEVCSRMLEGAGWNHWGLYIYAFAVWFCALGFISYAMMLIILAKLAVALLLSVGPIFILLLIFTDTKALFEGWLKTLLNYAIIPIFVYALLALLLALAESPLRYLEKNSGIDSNLLTTVGPFLMIAVISMFLLGQIMNVASTITGGLSLSMLGTDGWTMGKLGNGAKMATATSVAWSWKKSAPTRKRLTEKVKSGTAALQHALSRNQNIKLKKKLEEHFKAGESWDQEIYASMRLSRNRAWAVAFFGMAIAVLSLICLSLLLPLKTFSPYVVTVDRQSGYVEVTKGLYGGDLSQDEAVTQSNLVRYISARESYNPSILRENYDFVALLSNGTALKEFQHLWDGNNPENPSILLGRKAGVDVKIKSVSFLNDKTASVRFLRELHENDQIRVSHWNAIIDFQYVQKPEKMADRFQNPLGFQITSYRINPDSLEKVK